MKNPDRRRLQLGAAALAAPLAWLSSTPARAAPEVAFTSFAADDPPILFVEPPEIGRAHV